MPYGLGLGDGVLSTNIKDYEDEIEPPRFSEIVSGQSYADIWSTYGPMLETEKYPWIELVQNSNNQLYLVGENRVFAKTEEGSGMDLVQATEEDVDHLREEFDKLLMLGDFEHILKPEYQTDER